jgi:hypothetical protein
MNHKIDFTTIQGDSQDVHVANVAYRVASENLGASPRYLAPLSYENQTQATKGDRSDWSSPNN